MGGNAGDRMRLSYNNEHWDRLETSYIIVFDSSYSYSSLTAGLIFKNSC